MARPSNPPSGHPNNNKLTVLIMNLLMQFPQPPPPLTTSIFLSNIILASCYVTAFHLCTSFPAKYKNFEPTKNVPGPTRPVLQCLHVDVPVSNYWGVFHVISLPIINLSYRWKLNVPHWKSPTYPITLSRNIARDEICRQFLSPQNDWN